MDDCLFCKIVSGEIPSKKVYEDEHTYAFEDIAPKAPTHVLIVPKKHIRGLKEARRRMRRWWGGAIWWRRRLRGSAGLRMGIGRC